MTPSISRAIIGGLIGTIIMTLMMMYLAPMMTGHSMDIAAMLGGMMGGWMVGMVVHVILGVIVFPIIYVLFFYHVIGGTCVVRGMAYGIVLWLIAVVVVMPLAGAGVLMSNVGGMKAVIAALIGHLVYGGIVGSFAGYELVRRSA
ncbi:MAG TPA: hypothetical protein ENJ91_04345 [Rhodobacteraceae bacterium]|nr:hypothetical protein [Paracoccaceae bacterium]